MLTDFGKFCRKLRIDNNELMKDMASKLNCTSSYLSAVEKGKRPIPSTWAEKIAEYYDLTEQQIKELTKIVVINSLSEREKAALNEAISVIYLNDSSDYINGLWRVVKSIIGANIVESDEFDLKGLIDTLGIFKD